mgnify:CR=1 FL=1
MSDYCYRKYEKYESGLLVCRPTAGKPSFLLMQHRFVPGRTRGRAALFGTKNLGRSVSQYDLLQSYFNYRQTCANIGTSLHVCPECSISRDMLRNSGYVIKMKPDGADYIVIPRFESDVPKLHFNVAASCRNTMLFLTVTRAGDRVSDSIPDFITDDMICNFLKSLDYDVKYIFRNRCLCEFVPYVRMFETLLDMPFSNRPVVTEDRVQLIPTSKICVETLDVWKNINDAELLGRLISGSDWENYPVTLCVFLSEYKPYMQWPTSRYFRYVLDSIGYNSNDTLLGMLSQRIVQPDDWDMLQSFIMHDLGVPEAGGYISMNAARRNSLLRFCRSATAVKPSRISTPTLFSEIREKNK